MRKVSEDEIIKTIKLLVKQANFTLKKEIKKKIISAEKQEINSDSKKILKIIFKNLEIAQKEKIPICQDTGMVEVFLKIGNNVHINLKKYSSFQELIDEAITQAYTEFFLRKSIVSPIERKNTGTNTPSILWTEIVKGEKINIFLILKGFGSENVTRLKMFNPFSRTEEIDNFIIECVKKAGPNACPPFFIGIGIGGTSDKTVFLSKQALLNSGKTLKTEYFNWEEEIKRKVNKLNIGVCGLGGAITCFDVKIKSFPTHIAGLPVSVSISCWAHRMAEITI
jgi:fumarate hydratase subunit alpha